MSGIDFRNIEETLSRLDIMIDQEEDLEKIRAGLGMRLALSMARELQSGKPLGTDTADLVAEWTERFGSDTVDMAVKIARTFLVDPKILVRDLGTRLGLKTEVEEPVNENADEAEDSEDF